MPMYGGDKTIHQSEHVDVEVHNGKVVAVWFRCLPLKFRQADVGPKRAAEMEDIDGAEVKYIEIVDYLDT